MKKKLVSLAIALALPWQTATALANPHLSANVPISGPAAEAIEKLSGLGYFPVLTGTKPYSKAQAAAWLAAMDRSQQPPAYVESLLRQVQDELGTNSGDSFRLRQTTLSAAYYHGNPIGLSRPQSSYQPFGNYQNGYGYAPQENLFLRPTLEGKLSANWVLHLTPRINYDSEEHGKVTLESGYIKTSINHLAVQIGKDSMWWGQGKNGSLLLTNHAEPLTTVTFSSLTPVQHGGLLKKLGPSQTVFFYGELEKHRSDVNSPSIVGFRKDFSPSDRFTFAVSRVSIVGGEGRALHGSDYWKFLTGKNSHNTADDRDKWNSIAGFDFRYRIPHANGVQLYGELYGEDQAKYLPSHVASLVGVYIPRLTPSGDWDATLEWAQTNRSWYVHSVYTNGWAYRGKLLGDAMGGDAERFYLNLNRYLKDGSRIGIHAEHVDGQFQDGISSVQSYWLSYQTSLRQGVELNSCVGTGNHAKNRLVQIQLTYRH